MDVGRGDAMLVADIDAGRGGGRPFAAGMDAGRGGGAVPVAEIGREAAGGP